LQAAWRPKSAKWSRTGSARITPTRLRKRRLPPGASATRWDLRLAVEN
jgi:hypothetical protein